MRTVIGTLALAHPGGTETYCLTVARELDRLGHDVTLFADELGPFADQAADEGFDIARGPADLPTDCDAVLANDAITAGLLAERYPDTRLVYCVHSGVFDVQLPPLAPGLVDAIVAPSERFAAFGRALALDVPVVRLTQPIDTERFSPSLPPRSPARRALLLGNYLDGPRREALLETWTEAGVRCVQVGMQDRVFDVRPHIAEADIVVGKARAALEAMACGKAVYVYDAFGGDGWVTADTYALLEADNFAGMATERPVDRRQLAGDLARYDPDMGWINRELAVTHHGARAHVQKLVEVLRGPRPRRPETTSSAGAAARVVRSAWRARVRAMSLERDLNELRARLQEATTRLDEAEEATRAALLARDACEGRAREAEREIAVAQRLIGTRRVRAGLALGGWVDRALGRR